MFEQPALIEAKKAIGNTSGLTSVLQRAFSPGEDFELLPPPSPGDWLAEHCEPRQSFDEYVRSGVVKPDRHRDKIYLQPLGEFTESNSLPINKLAIFTSAFFMMHTELLPRLETERANFSYRINQFTGKRQILTLDILSLLTKEKPQDAYCILAITMEDLYPEPSWNFVFGQASPLKRVGVFSFARYDLRFYGEKRPFNYEKILLKRSCKVLAHEIGHMFLLAHCIYFKCLMNGSNHLRESDARPLFLCPVCLRKLYFAIGFNVVTRYEKLSDFFFQEGFEEEASWIKKRLKWILAGIR